MEEPHTWKTWCGHYSNEVSYNLWDQYILHSQLINEFTSLSFLSLQRRELRMQAVWTANKTQWLAGCFVSCNPQSHGKTSALATASRSWTQQLCLCFGNWIRQNPSGINCDSRRRRVTGDIKARTWLRLIKITFSHTVKILNFKL